MAPAQASMRIFAAMRVAGHHQNGHLLATKLKRAKGFLCLMAPLNVPMDGSDMPKSFKIDQNRFSCRWETAGASNRGW